jgi:hypothetical protein
MRSEDLARRLKDTPHDPEAFSPEDQPVHSHRVGVYIVRLILLPPIFLTGLSIHCVKSSDLSAIELRISPEKENILPSQDGCDEEINQKGIKTLASICLLRPAPTRNLHKRRGPGGLRATIEPDHQSYAFLST